MYYGVNTLAVDNPLKPMLQDYMVVLVQEFYNPITGKVVEKVKREPIVAFNKHDANRIAEELTHDKFRRGQGVYRVKEVRKV